MLQETALNILKSGKNVFLTGSAGAGKTYVLNQYIQYLRERGVATAITASTGIAATHISGQTIHSWSGVGIKDEITPADLEKLAKKKPLRDQIESTQVLIIDEISMLSGKTLSNINQILQFFKVSFEAFGGIQVIFCGDFFQLPPVSKNREPNYKKFAFMDPSWVDSKLHICYLTEQHRQSGDQLSELLNEIRSGEVSESMGEMLRENMEESATKDFPAIKLFTHNADVDNVNIKELKKLETEENNFYGETEGNAQLANAMKKSVLAPEELCLKEGAQVIFVKNNYEMGYLNGTMGTITGFSTDLFPIVTTLDGNEIIAKQTDWSVYDESGQVVAAYKQIPLRLAWAITVHKSQGMTLDEAEIDLSKTFEPGQGYVALSRVRSWEGLHLKGCNHQALILDELAMKADKRFQELSDINEGNFQDQNQETLEQMWKQFIIKSGGTTDPVLIEDIKSKLGKPKKVLPKVSTYDQTKKLVEMGKTLEEIIETRGISENTIINHLIQLKKDHPDLNLDLYKPAPEVLEEIQLAEQVLREINDPEDFDQKGLIKLKVLFEQLEEEYSYDDIKHARIFFE